SAAPRAAIRSGPTPGATPGRPTPLQSSASCRGDTPLPPPDRVDLQTTAFPAQRKVALSFQRNVEESTAAQLRKRFCPEAREWLPFWLQSRHAPGLSTILYRHGNGYGRSRSKVERPCVTGALRTPRLQPFNTSFNFHTAQRKTQGRAASSFTVVYQKLR